MYSSMQALFLNTFLVTAPRLDDVTDDHRYSRLLVDFPSVRVSWQHFSTIHFSKKGPFKFLRGLFEELWVPFQKFIGPFPHILQYFF